MIEIFMMNVAKFVTVWMLDMGNTIERLSHGFYSILGFNRRFGSWDL